MIEPPRWSSEELERNRLIGIERFREERMREPLERYLDLFDKRRGDVEELLETLVDMDLTKIDDQAIVMVLTKPTLLDAFRYLPGPPISKDDLKVLAQSSLSAKSLKAPERARVVFKTMLEGLDRRRFPWVSEEREPTEAEKQTAIVASASLIASQRIATDRRNEGKTLQEAAVFATLEGAGFKRVATRSIGTLADAPGLGEFCGESMLGDRKADIVVRLWDRRVLAIECKVSNSATNSIKRLNNDAAAKAEHWLKMFGSAQLVPSATLTGVFKLGNLEDAQKAGLTLFWAHDLVTLTDWIEGTRP
ncbi:MAG: XamI family restriction endonuclease [Candidatus Limnocylindria bacterium]